VASQRAAQIRLDILSGNFDETLEKYKGDRIPQQGKDLGAVVLFERFIEMKSHQTQPRTLEKYRGLLVWLRDFFGDRPATEADASPFIAWLGENLEPVTAHERLGLLKAAWHWGMEQDWVSENPWEGHVIRKPSKQKPIAFTKAEVESASQSCKTHLDNSPLR
jgi:integrase